MDYDKKLMDLIENGKGLILTKDVDRQGIPREYISRFIEKGILKRIDRGSYSIARETDDPLYRFQQKYSKTIFSHQMALYLNNLSEQLPDIKTVTIPAGYNGTNLRNSGITVYTVKKELHHVGLKLAETSNGHYVYTYNIERTICDLVRNRSKIGNDTLIASIKKYIHRTDKDMSQLLKMAEMFNVHNIIIKYLEILL